MLPVCLAIACVGLLLPASRLAALWLAGVGLLMAIVGFIDDMRGLAALVRLVAQVCAAGAYAAVGVGVGLTFVGETPRLSLVGPSLIGGLAATLWTLVVWRERS